MKNTFKTLVLIAAVPIFFTGLLKAQWVEQNSGTTNWLISVQALKHNSAWVAGGSGTVLNTNSSGTHWRNVSISGAADIWSIYALDHKTVFAIGFTADWSATAIWRTANNGATWKMVLSLPSSNYMLNCMTFFDDKEGIVCGDPDYAFPSPNYWTIYKTYDGGLTWAPITNPPTQDGMNFGWKNSMTHVRNTVFFGTTMFDDNFNFDPDARIYKSIDRGEHWTYAVTPGVVQVNTIQFINAMTGYACRAKTIDGGVTWFAMNDPYATVTGDINNFILSATGVGKDVWVTGIHREGPAYFSDSWNNYTTVYYSANGGTTWTLEYTVPTGTPNEVKISADNKALYLIQDDGGIAYKELGTIKEMIVSGDKSNKLIGNYPNPFNPSTSIKYQIQNSGLVTLKVYDIVGKEVATLVNEIKQPGSYDVRFDARSLSSGAYFYKLITGNFTETKRMLLVK
jgi:photosystem II stability/assembly factor-like uncharacterized protein